ncbi:hypothetical protein CL617_05510 [archaeon]|nr:hypothetical protein [archaeon]|tara:strand:+ start:951 stop:1493 length:543 start_codon:yes stop_codon:yes gene_type:complete
MKRGVKVISSLLLIGVIFLLAGCGSNEETTTTISTNINVDGWRNVELLDIRTGENFKINDFDKPILLESFAVWCPTCLKQQREIQKLIDLEGDRVVHISLDTDPNEDETIVKDHALENGFNWYFAVPKIETTRELIEEFGVTFVNAPSAPVALVCNGKAELLKNGVKSAEELQEIIDSRC